MKIDRSGDCWTWTAATTQAGYGVLSWRGGTAYAHRLSYEEHVGTIPEGMVIDHLCRNRACVNPEHLEVVTYSENIQRGRLGFNLTGRCNSGKHEMVGDTIRITSKGSRECRQCKRDREREYRRVHGRRKRTSG